MGTQTAASPFPSMINKLFRSPAQTAVAVVALCGLGFYLGRLSIPPATTPPPNAAATLDHAKVTDVSSAPTINAMRSAARREQPAAMNSWDEGRWQDLLSQPATIARNKALADLMEELAAAEPQRALKLAQAEKNLKLRENLLHAALRGWGRTATEGAANWALALADENDRSASVAAVFTGAAGRPDEAARVAQKLFADHPGEATGYGNSLIDALCDAGNFSDAIQFAGHTEDTVQHSIWLAEAYSRWATLQPEEAARNAAGLSDPTARTEALHGIVGGWADADPAGLTHFLAELPSGTDHGAMLGQALQSWVRLDPEAAAAWINNRDASSDYDEGVAAVASVNFVKVDLALNWAETISNPKLRSETIAEVLHGWVIEDPAAAKQYFTATKNLLPEDRQRIGDIIATTGQVSQ
jgi:hypothetical protein